jgi:hypothetical protein
VHGLHGCSTGRFKTAAAVSTINPFADATEEEQNSLDGIDDGQCCGNSQSFAPLQ